MSTHATKDRQRRLRFSLSNMLTVTAIVAVWFASILAMRKEAVLKRDKTVLLALSSRLVVDDPRKVQLAAYPRVADDFETWDVHVPEKESLELRLAFAEVSQAGMPQAFEKVPLASGRHRVTLYFADSFDKGYRYEVYVDGTIVFDGVLGHDWMPDGWRQASGLNPPPESRENDSALLQLDGKVYTPRHDYGLLNYFNGQSDDWVNRPGYRLWIDRVGRSYPPTSPFMGFDPHSLHEGIGLRGGLRFNDFRSGLYEWKFTRPASQTNSPVLTIVPEFFAGDRVVLSDQTKTFSRWQRRNDPRTEESLPWQLDPLQTSYSFFFCADVKSPDMTEPVVEVRWDASRPNDVGFRLADTLANEELTKWRLRIVGGTKHLWRLLDVDDQKTDVREKSSDKSQTPLSEPLPIKLQNESGKPHVIAWRSDITKPLQLLKRSRVKPNPYLGIDLYKGMPLTFGAEIPEKLHPTASIVRANSHPGPPSIPIPGGPVVTEIRIDLDATVHDWVWLRAESP